MKKKANNIEYHLPEEIIELTEDQQDELRARLSDQEWRLDNLYYITDQNGVKVRFVMNKAQRFLYRNRWFLNLILKARQRGITTFISIFFLDSVLFSANQSALIIAHTLDDARKIFDTKIKFAWDNLPDWLKTQFDVDTNTIYQLKFKTNGGSIAVSTSGRSGTFQFLHISEFGIICARWPEKAREIVTGTLQTVHIGNLAFIESTSKGRSGYFYDYCMQSMRDKKSGKKLSAQDWKFFFFPWWEDEKYVLSGNIYISEEMEEYFKKLEDVDGIKLTKEQKNWYVKKIEKLGDDMYSEFPSTPEEAFKASIEGAYFSKEMNKAYGEKRITQVPFDKALLVYTFWDIGMSDETTIWFVQFFGNQIRLIDLYHNEGESIHHYASVLQNKAMTHGYVYGGHYGPHDLEVREIGNEFAKSRRQIASSIGLNFNIVTRHSVDVGIDEARAMFNMCWFDEKKCERGISALQEYRKEWDDKNGTWKQKPLHNWASHYADGFRLLAMTYKTIMGGGYDGTSVRGREKDDYGRANNNNDFDRHSPTGGWY